MKRYFFTIVLSILWSSVSIVSYFHPGDEYGIYAYSNIIGVWPFFIFQPDIYSLLTPAMVALIGGLTMAIVGFGMDKLRVNLYLWGGTWAIISILLVIVTVNQYPTIQKALSKNGSWTAYITGSMNMGLYFSVIISVIFRTIVLVARQFKQIRVVEHKSSVQ